MSPAETERAPRGSTRVVCRVRPLATSERGSCVETRGAEDKSFAREVLDFCNAYGGAVFGSMLLVGVLTTVLIVWASHVEQRSGGGGARRALAATTLSSL